MLRDVKKSGRNETGMGYGPWSIVICQYLYSGTACV